MIITFWMYAYCLFDTPEYKTRLEARRLTQSLKLYTDYKLELMHASKDILNLPTSSLHLCSPFQQNR